MGGGGGEGACEEGGVYIIFVGVLGGWCGVCGVCVCFFGFGFGFYSCGFCCSSSCCSPYKVCT